MNRQGEGPAGMRVAVETEDAFIRLFFWMVTNQTIGRVCFLAGPLLGCSGGSWLC